MSTSKPFTFDVFLSHSHKDKRRVRSLAVRLRAAGLRVWLDDWVIKPGNIIYRDIEEGLTKAGKLVLCLSPAALESGWIVLEVGAAIHRDPSNTKGRFIPLWLVDCQVPEILKPYKLVDFRRGTANAFAELLTACRENLSPENFTPGAEHVEPGSALDDFQRSLSPELRRAFDQHLNQAKRLGSEEPNNEDGYINLRRGFLKDQENILEELFQRAMLCHPDRLDLSWMEIRHEVGRIFLEKRRGAEALDLLGGMQELIERCDDATRRLYRRPFAKILDSIGEAVRFGPERDTTRAKHLFEMALALSPKNHFALKHLGTIHRIEHRYEEAEACFQRALTVNKTHHVLFSLGYLYSEWEDGKNDKVAMARKQYDSCEQTLRTKKIHDYYRIYLKDAFLALRQDNVDAAVASALKALNVLEQSLRDEYVEVSRFAADLLLAVLYGDLDNKALRFRRCEEYLQAKIDDISFSVFDCVYRDLKREIEAKESILNVRVTRLSKDQKELANRFDRIIDTLRLKESLFLRQKQNRALIRSGSSIETVFPRLDGELVVYLKVLPGRKSQILPALEPFHEIQCAAESAPYSLKLSFESIARQSSGALSQVSKALELLLDHAALVALDKADSTHFEFDNSLWRPFTALISLSLQRFGFPDHFSLPEMYGRNGLVRIFSSKLIGVDPDRKRKRVFLNPRVGCSVGCSFCYLPAYGIPIDRGRAEIREYAVDVGSLVRALEAKGECFIPGPGGSLLSVGSFTEPFLAPLATLELLHSLASFGNPLQIATRLFPGAEVIRQIEEELGANADHLMINLSMNKPDEGVRGVVDRWLNHKGRLHLAVYAKPFMDQTIDCLGYFEKIGKSMQEISFIVGSLYFGGKVGLSPSEIRNHRLEPALRSPVVAHPTTPGMRNNAEEDFRLRLQGTLGRTVFRTSSCALAAKMRIPDPLGNFDGPFCVAGCSNESICRRASHGPSAGEMGAGDEVSGAPSAAPGRRGRG